MDRRHALVASVFPGLFLPLDCAGQAAAAKAPSAAATPPRTKTRSFDVDLKEWKGDFDGMLQRRLVRIYVPYSRTLYFIDKGRERGIAADLLRSFERWVNRKYAKQTDNRPITIVAVVATRDELLADLLGGSADIAVGNIKVIPELQKHVDFVADDKATSVEVLATGPASPKIASVDDLSGKTVHVRKVSSYHLSLQGLNQRLKAAGKPEARLVLVPDALEDEDMLEMLNAGLLPAIVVDDWKAKMWAQVLPKVKVREDIQLRPRTRLGWAIRKGSPRLAAELNEFYAWYAKQAGGATRLVSYYMERTKALRNAAADADEKRFRVLEGYFREYGTKYGFDPLMLAAQGYQESALRQDAKSPVGAIGVMQIMPATAREMNVGDIRRVEPNIHAGAKFMDQLMTNYFKGAKFDEQNRTLFAFASYNAGPGNIQKMRTEAEQRKLDPDQWLNNVEVVTADRIGLETTTYVRNIFKYYAAYKLASEAEEEAASLKRKMAPARK